MDAKEAQIALAQMGLYEGKIDGQIGPLTRLAIRFLQALFGLRKTGKLDEKTQEVLKPPAPKEVAAPVLNRVWPTRGDVPAFYGQMGLHQTTLLLPFPMKLAWDQSKTVTRFSIHEKVHDSAARAFDRIAKTYSAKERAEIGIDLFGGCLNVRKMRGGSAWSMHSWGIAIDFDPARNQLAWGRDRARLAREDAIPFWQAWEAEGWYSLGRRENRDWMHVEATCGR